MSRGRQERTILLVWVEHSASVVAGMMVVAVAVAVAVV
jgi:hypothetical protein